ncbi:MULTISPECIES: glycosyltransferase [unclassified Polaribacter]|uniref:glycosyltransferase n=1 Tax=unclassified Polaribacter TaxID=196858 RepID=UPI00267535DB|nr:glycosyltransferase [Polaribacter sp. Q13]
MPVLNNLKGLKKTVKSIQNQSLNNFEVWIIDGGSKTKTQEYLKTLRPPFNYISEKDKGIYNAMNKGVLRSKGKWLYFLGSGDLLASNWVIENLSKELDLKFDLIIGEISYCFKTISKNFKSKWSSIMWVKNTVHHQSIFYNKTIFNENLYNTNYKILSDYDFNLSLFANKSKVKTVSTVIALCEPYGVSKNYNWSLYKEEILLKTNNSIIFLKPIFSIIALLKFLIRKIAG